MWSVPGAVRASWHRTRWNRGLARDPGRRRGSQCQLAPAAFIEDGQDRVGHLLDERLEVVGLGREVGFALQLHQGGTPIGLGDGDDALNANLYGDNVSITASGDAGDDNLSSSAGEMATISLDGGEGDDTIDGGAGDDHITAGAGVDRIVVSDGTDQLTDFTQADDVLDVSHAGYADFATVQANLSDAASGAILSHAGGSIQLTGIGIAMLDATDFVYA